MTEQDKFPSEDNNAYFFDEFIENDNCLCAVLSEKSKSDEKDKNFLALVSHMIFRRQNGLQPL